MDRKIRPFTVPKDAERSSKIRTEDWAAALAALRAIVSVEYSCS